MWWRWPKNVILQFCCLVIPVLTWHPLPLETRLKRLSIFKPAQTNYFESDIIVVYYRNHYFGLGLIKKPKPKLATTTMVPVSNVQPSLNEAMGLQIFFSSFRYTFMHYFLYKIGLCFVFFHLKCTETF